MDDNAREPLNRLRCCVCGSDDMDFAYDYVQMTLECDDSTAQQMFGAHATCLTHVLAPGFNVEIIN